MLAIVVIFSALLVGLGKLLMPYSDRFQPALESWLSREFGRNVTLQSFDGEWKAFGPRLTLQDLRLHSSAGGAGEIAIARAALEIKPLNALIPGKALYNFLVIGADFKLVHEPDGQYELSGLGVGGSVTDEGGSGLRGLVGLGELILENSTLEYLDEANDVRLTLKSIDARIQFDGETLALDLNAGLTDEVSHQVYGDVNASGILQLAEIKGFTESQWHVAVSELELQPLRERLPPSPFLLQDGQLNGELWVDWRTGQPVAVAGSLDLLDGRLEIGEQPLEIEHLSTLLALHYSEKGTWRLDLNQLEYADSENSWTAPSVTIARNLGEDLGLWISADYLPLDVPLKLTRSILSAYQKAWPASIPGAATGDVSGFDLVFNHNWHLQLARGTVRQANLSDWGHWPDLQGLDGTVNLERGAGLLSLHAGNLGVRWPGMFAEPLEFSLPGCEVELVWGEHWQVGLHECQLLNDDITAKGEAVFAGNEGRPAVDVNVEVSRGKIANLSPYWPQELMGENVVHWLRKGLKEGAIVHGRFQIHGDMDYWPFRQGEGTFEAFAQVEDGELIYAPEWPVATQVNALARFKGASMFIEGSVGDIGGVGVKHVTARIDDLKKPMLEVDYTAESRLDSLVAFLDRSPLRQRLDADLSRFKFSGPADTFGAIRIPLGATPGELTVDGSVQLKHDQFSDPGTGVVLEAIDGQVHYSRQGLAGTGINALYKGEKASLDLAGDTNSQERFRANMHGRFETEDILPEFLLDARGILGRVHGASEWQVSVIVPAATPGEDSSANLMIRSNLEGIALDFPAPLAKEKTESWPLELHYPLNGASRVLDVQLKDRVQLQLDLMHSETDPASDISVSGALIQLGEGTGDRPAHGLARIEGLTPVLDLDGWIDIVVDGVKSGGGLAGLDLERCEIAAGNLLFLDRQFDSVYLTLNIAGTNVNARFLGKDINGQVTFSPEPGQGDSLSAEFERLALGTPMSSGLDVETNPGDLPALHLYARSFRYAGIEMGETRIEAYPVSNGFHFEKVESESDELRIRASGDWLLSNDGPRSDFNILMTAESLGALMHSLDISSSLEGGQTVLRFTAWWAGSPAAFALSRLNGEVEFSVESGQITDASVGTGRVLGLLSLQALPRRLSLDFRDVFDSGFDFDEAKGTFHLENGTARTDDVELSSTVAKIRFTGSTDLVAQRYDQLMTVQPGVGNTLPIIGAIAGGPAGAAAGVALQGLFQKQLGAAMQAQYTITGTWDEPVIEQVESKEASDKKRAVKHE